jgi:ABC-2 type transport system ATP-binding protein
VPRQMNVAAARGLAAAKRLGDPTFFCWMAVTGYPIGVERDREAPPGGHGSARESLVMRGVSRSYRARPVLRGVDLTVNRGESVLVTGPNGSGKTTLLRLVTGVITPEAGSISLFGRDTRAHRGQSRRGIGFLPAGDRAIYARLTVRNNLEFWARIAFVPRADRRAMVDRALRDFGLEELAGCRADRISMGQRQRARLAMAFLHEPGLILLDEPDTSLDEDGLRLLRTAGQAALSRGASVLWCSPTGGREVLGADNAYVIAGGRLEPA